MKTKLFSLLFISVLAGWVLETSAQVQVNFSVYARIPMAPNVIFEVGATNMPSPSPDYIWVDSYWAWDVASRGYVWMEGYWTLPPYVGAYWLPGYWERASRGYVWINAGWVPRHYKMHYGYCNGRYDYYGRPVYYHKPTHASRGYIYAYDHRSDYRKGGYSSSAYYNSRQYNKNGNDHNRYDRDYNKNRNDYQYNRNNNQRDDYRSKDNHNNNNKADRNNYATNPNTQERRQPVYDNGRNNNNRMKSNDQSDRRLETTQVSASNESNEEVRGRSENGRRSNYNADNKNNGSRSSESSGSSRSSRR